jgi:hypothetical protein
MKKHIINIFVLLFSFALFAQADSVRPKINITVWIHGTSPSQAFTPTKKLKSCQMFHIPSLPTSHSAHVRLTLLENLDGDRFSKEHAYFFKWSGTASPKARKIAGEKLAHDLYNIISYYRYVLGYDVNLTIITHSHGGNVLIRAIQYAEKNNIDISIDCAILFACPVFAKTKKLITLPQFKQIIVFFSPTDVVQVMDPQKYTQFKFNKEKYLSFFKAFNAQWKKNKTFFTRRIFTKDKAHIIHFQISWRAGVPWHRVSHLSLLPKTRNWKPWLKLMSKNRGLSHFEFTMEPFLLELPSLVKQADEVFAKRIKNFKPENIYEIIKLEL